MFSGLEMQSLAGKPKSNVKISPLAGKPVLEMQVELARLELLRSAPAHGIGSSRRGGLTAAR